MKNKDKCVLKACKTTFILLLSLYSFVLYAQQTPLQKRDSLRRLIPTLEGKEKLDAWRDMSNIYFSTTSTPEQLDTLLAIYDAFEAEAIRQKNVNSQALVKGNRVMAFSNMRMYDEVNKRAPECLDFLSTHELWKFYYPVANTYIKTKIKTEQYDEALEIARNLQKQAEEAGQQEGVGTALHAIANIYLTMRRNEDAIIYYKQAVEIVDKIEPVSSSLPMIYFDLCQSLLGENRYEEVEETAKAFEKANQRWEERTGMKEYPSKMNLLQIYTRLFLDTERYDKAETYCNAMDSIGGVGLNRQAIIGYRVRIYEARKEYDKALLMINKEIELSRKERGTSFSALLMRKARILSKLGQAEESFNLAEESFLLRDSIRSLDLNKQLDEVRTQYEVDRHIFEKQRNRNYFLLAITGCVLLAIALAIWIIYSRRLRAKNRVLYEQIQARNQCRIINENTLIRHPQEELSREMCLFRDLSLLMKEEKLFTDPTLDRRTLAERLGTNEKYIADAIHAGSQETLSAYITRQRLQYATELLDTQSELTLEAIAADAGFGSYPPFYRAFSKTYGMTPRDYRLFAQRKDGN